MGRRSLPLAADFFLGLRDTDVLTALRTALAGATVLSKKNSDCLSIYADARLKQDGALRSRKDYVISFSREPPLRVPPEVKIAATVQRTARSTEHDAFGALGG